MIHRPGNVVKHRLLTRYDQSFRLYEEKLLDRLSMPASIYIYIYTYVSFLRSQIGLISLFREAFESRLNCARLRKYLLEYVIQKIFDTFKYRIYI